MGIKFKSEDEYTDRLVPSAPLAVVSGADAIVAPFTGFIKSIYAYCAASGTQGTGGTTIPTFNIKKNNANLFTDAAPITFASGSSAPVYSAADFTSGLQLSFSKGDILSLDVTAIFNGTGPVQPNGCACYVLLKRKSLGGFIGVATGTSDPTDTRP